LNPFQPHCPRRALLAAALGTLLTGVTRGQAAVPQTTVPAVPFVDGVNLTIAGPDNGALDTWAQILSDPLKQFLPSGAPFQLRTAGGLDGITGANQFEAEAHPDGTSLLLAPGTAALGWLLGEPRVQFDMGRWVPLLSGFCPMAIAGRVAASDLKPGQRLRIGISSPNGPEIAAVLGLNQLGLSLVPVPDLVDYPLTLAAFAQDAVDLILLRGPHILSGLAVSGAQPVCVLGSPDASGQLSRDPTLPEWPHLGELMGGLPDEPLTTGWQATALAAQLSFALVLPQLTPAAIVALWRRAVAHAVGLPDVNAAAVAQTLRLHTDPRTMQKLTSDADARAQLRSWTNERATP
jgi:hypothetical protein